MHISERLMWAFFDVSLTTLRALVPASFGWLLVRAAGGKRGDALLKQLVPSWLVTPLTVYALGEVCFYIGTRVILWRRKQTCTAKTKRREMTPAERARTLRLCLGTCGDRPREMLTQWIHDEEEDKDTPTNYAETKEFIAFAMFHKNAPEDVEDPAELDALVEIYADALRTAGDADALARLEDASSSSRRLMKFAFEPPRSAHRPLPYYLAVDFVFQSCLVPLRMSAWGGYERIQRGSAVLWRRAAPRPEGGRPPLVFIHGIGVGLLPYSDFFSELENSPEGQTRDIIVLEIGVISQRYNPQDVHALEFASDFRLALRDMGHERIELIGHSYGTFVSAWIIRHAPGLIQRLVLIDPTTLLLHHTDVLYNILYKPRAPYSPLERVLDYVMRSDPFFQVHLRDSFVWYENVLFEDDIPSDLCVLVIFSERDQVFPVQRAQSYVGSWREQRRAKSVVLDGIDHGGFLVEKSKVKKVVQEINALLAFHKTPCE